MQADFKMYLPDATQRLSTVRYLLCFPVNGNILVNTKKESPEICQIIR
jgi:hypothetical protein